MQNGFIESFNARLRDEFLNETLFTMLAQARVALLIWRCAPSKAPRETPTLSSTQTKKSYLQCKFKIG